MIPIDGTALDEPEDIFCYFARFTDQYEKKLTAMRRAAHFKGVLKKKMIILRSMDDTLRITDDKFFKLDADFDLLVDSHGVHVWRPLSYEILGNLDQSILDSVENNVTCIGHDLNFLNTEIFKILHLKANAQHGI